LMFLMITPPDFRWLPGFENVFSSILICLTFYPTLFSRFFKNLFLA
jgi:hypothetical protein